MKILKTSKNTYLSFSFYNEWKEWFTKRFHWRDFTFIRVHLEMDNYGEKVWRRVITNFSLLGFCIGIDFTKDDLNYNDAGNPNVPKLN